MREWEVGIDSGLIKKGEAPFRCEGKIGVRDAHLSRVMDPERIRGRVMNVEVSEYKERKGEGGQRDQMG